MNRGGFEVGVGVVLWWLAWFCGGGRGLVVEGVVLWGTHLRRPSTPSAFVASKYSIKAGNLR